MYFYDNYFNNNHCKAPQNNYLDGALYKKYTIIIIIIKIGRTFICITLPNILGNPRFVEVNVQQVDKHLVLFMT